MTVVTAPITHFLLELRDLIRQNLLEPTEKVILTLAQVKVELLVGNHQVKPLYCHL